MKRIRNLFLVMAVLLMTFVFAGSALAAASDGSKATANVNVRSGPSTSYEKLGKLKKGESIQVVAVGEEWVEIDFAGGSGYVFKKYVKLMKSENQYPRISAKADAEGNVKSEASATQSTDYDWKERAKYKVGKTMGIDVYAPDKDRSIAIADSDMYDGPGTFFKKLGQMKTGQKLSIHGVFGDWVEVRYGSSEGFVLRSAVKAFHPIGNYKGADAEFVAIGGIYGKPSASSELLATFVKGDVIGEARDIKDGWIEFPWGGGVAYTLLKNIRFIL